MGRFSEPTPQELDGTAKPSEIIIGEELYGSVQADYPDLESRTVDVRDREAQMQVRVLTLDRLR